MDDSGTEVLVRSTDIQSALRAKARTLLAANCATGIAQNQARTPGSPFRMSANAVAGVAAPAMLNGKGLQ